MINIYQVTEKIERWRWIQPLPANIPNANIDGVRGKKRRNSVKKLAKYFEKNKFCQWILPALSDNKTDSGKTDLHLSHVLLPMKQHKSNDRKWKKYIKEKHVSGFKSCFFICQSKISPENSKLMKYEEKITNKTMCLKDTSTTTNNILCGFKTTRESIKHNPKSNTNINDMPLNPLRKIFNKKLFKLVVGGRHSNRTHFQAKARYNEKQCIENGNEHSSCNHNVFRSFDGSY